MKRVKCFVTNFLVCIGKAAGPKRPAALVLFTYLALIQACSMAAQLGASSSSVQISYL